MSTCVHMCLHVSACVYMCPYIGLVSAFIPFVSYTCTLLEFVHVWIVSTQYGFSPLCVANLIFVLSLFADTAFAFDINIMD